MNERITERQRLIPAYHRTAAEIYEYARMAYQASQLVAELTPSKKQTTTEFSAIASFWLDSFYHDNAGLVSEEERGKQFDRFLWKELQRSRRSLYRAVEVLERENIADDGYYETGAIYDHNLHTISVLNRSRYYKEALRTYAGNRVWRKEAPLVIPAAGLSRGSDRVGLKGGVARVVGMAGFLGFAMAGAIGTSDVQAERDGPSNQHAAQTGQASVNKTGQEFKTEKKAEVKQEVKKEAEVENKGNQQSQVKVRQEVKNEVEKALADIVRKEFAREVKTEVKEENKDKGEAKEEVKKEVKEEAKREAKDEVRREEKREARVEGKREEKENEGEAERRVRERVREETRDEGTGARTRIEERCEVREREKDGEVRKEEKFERRERTENGGVVDDENLTQCEAEELPQPPSPPAVVSPTATPVPVEVIPPAPAPALVSAPPPPAPENRIVEVPKAEELLETCKSPKALEQLRAELRAANFPGPFDNIAEMVAAFNRAACPVPLPTAFPPGPEAVAVQPIPAPEVLEAPEEAPVAEAPKAPVAEAPAEEAPEEVAGVRAAPPIERMIEEAKGLPKAGSEKNPFSRALANFGLLSVVAGTALGLAGRFRRRTL